MKRPSVWIAAISFGAIGVSAHWSAPPQSTSDVPKRVIAPPGPKPVGPYSPGILAGDFLYVSGQGGRDAEGKLPATIEGQARQTLLEREVHRRSRRVDDGACRLHPGVPGRHGAPRRDGPGLEGVLCLGTSGPRRARDLQAADGHRGRDQRCRVPRPHPQEACRPSGIPEEPVVVAGNDRGQPVVPVGIRAQTSRRAGCRPIRTRRCNWRSTT